MGFRSLANAYQSERRMIQSEARIWKRIHKDSEYRAWVLSTKDGPITQQLKERISSRSHRGAHDQEFCDSFIRLPGELRNQIYDELLMRHAQDSDAGDTLLFRSLLVTKRSHAAACFTGPMRLPIINHLDLLNLVGRDQRIWRELFSKWVMSAAFKLTEAFELQSKPPSIRDRLAFAQSSSQDLPFTRYRNDEASRVFDQSDPWFPLMRTCSLNLHIFNFGSPSFKDDRLLLSRLQACTREIASVLLKATNLANATINIYLWPDCYQESSSNATWSGHKRLPKMPVVWSGLEPLKSTRGIQSISIHAGSALHEEWTVADGILGMNA